MISHDTFCSVRQHFTGRNFSGIIFSRILINSSLGRFFFFHAAQKNTKTKGWNNQAYLADLLNEKIAFLKKQQWEKFMRYQLKKTA